jgi:ABC-type antimicrobial peptide transport system permease subunit
MATMFEAAMSTQLAQYAPWIAVLTFIAGLYLAFGKKEKRFIETVTSMKILVPAVIFFGVALAPASALAIFGSFQAAITLMLAVISAIIFPLLLVAGIVWLVLLFYPEALE